MIKDRIREDMKAAMRAHDAAGLSTIRLLLAAIKQREVDEQIEADDALILSVIAKMVKQRQDSVQQYLAGDRQDLADKESAEIKVLEAYLPKGLSDEEIAAVPARAHVELYYCPAQQPGAKFAIVLSGNSLYYSGELRGGVSTAWELHEQGYAVFSLRYRIGWEAGDDAPLEDLARAIRFVMDNADTFGVSTEDYALLGYSSGGQIAGVFGNEEKGWGRYGVPKPGVLLLAYPINNFFEAKPAYHLLMDTDRLERRYYSYTVSKLVTPDYPPTFLWYGRNDTMLKAFVYPLQGPTLAKALEASGVPNRVEVYDNAKHGIGIGVGTDAEDWVERAAEFWQSVSE